MENEAIDVDDALFEVLAAFSAAADEVKAPWLIIGATARILLLEKVYGWPQGLGTRDIDFGVQVGDWQHYDKLCNVIKRSGVSETERTPTKRFRTKKDMIFDLVPYGGVEDEKKRVFWPPHKDEVMTVRGFDAAANNAIHVIVNEELTVPVVSPVGLCALKFYAWEERHKQYKGRDAKDIAYLLNNIESLYSSDKLFSDYEDAVKVADYQIQNAGYYQLGCDVKKILPQDDYKFMSGFLSDEIKQNEDSSLCRELHGYTSMSSIDETQEALGFFYKGLCSD